MVSVLVLLSFGLVLVATVLLVLGLLADSGLALIYLSIGCSIVAGILLVVATRIGRPRAALATAGAAEASAPSPAPTAAVPVTAATSTNTIVTSSNTKAHHPPKERAAS